MDIRQVAVIDRFPVLVHTEDEDSYCGDILFVEGGDFLLTYNDGEKTKGLKNMDNVRKALKGTLANRRGECITVTMTFDTAIRLNKKGIFGSDDNGQEKQKTEAVQENDVCGEGRAPVL